MSPQEVPLVVFAQGIPPEGLLCVGLGALAIYLVLAAIAILAAVWFFNKLAGGFNAPEAVPEPSFGKALGISFVAFLVNFGVGMVLGLIAGATKVHPAAVQLVSMPVNLLVMSVMLSAMLPTTFGKGFVISLLTVAVLVAVFIAIFAVVLLPLGLAGGLMR